MTTALAFIFVLGVLIFIHELGHFLIAKKVGIRVERFSIGFPPYIFSRRRGETDYSIGLIPLGGFVKMAGENPDDGGTGAADEFMSKTIGQRVAVILAGPFMNYLLAVVLLIGIFMFGGRPIFDDTKVLVGTVSEDGPAYGAGLRENDQIVSVDGYAVRTFDSLRAHINKKLNAPLELTWLRGADTVRATVVTKIEQVPNQSGGMDSIGIIGFMQKPLRYESYGFFESIRRGFVSAHVIVWETIRFVKNFVTGRISAKMIGGPLFIAQQSGREAEKGPSSLFFFMALLSVNLAVLNVLPIPVLDGGHLVFLAVEKLRGAPLSMRARAVAQQVGLVFLFGLILFVTYNDIHRWLQSF